MNLVRGFTESSERITPLARRDHCVGLKSTWRVRRVYTRVGKGNNLKEGRFVAAKSLSHPEPAHVVTLVHGTFAHNAHWVKARSVLRDMLKLRIPDVEFRPFSWSGCNSHSERQKAALELREQLAAQVAAYPKAKHSIVAHSHGGNVALYALADQGLQYHVRAVACLNTPFLVPMRRGVGGFLGGPLILLAPLASMIAYPLFSLMIATEAGLRLSAMELAFRIGLFGALVGLFVGFLVLVEKLGWRRRLVNRRDRLVKSMSFPDLHMTSVKCLWSASDEVHDFFLLTEAIGNLPYNLLRLQSVGLAILIFFVLQMISLLPIFPWYSYVPVVSGLIAEALKLATSPISLPWVIAVFYSTAIYITAYMLVLEISAIGMNLVFRLLPLGVGSLNVWDSHYVRLATSIVPVANARVSFEDFDVGSGLLIHSRIYDDERAVARLAELVATEVTERRSTQQP